MVHTNQSRCRFWNLSIASILVLTFSNILLTVRLLHNSDSRNSNGGVPLHYIPKEKPLPPCSPVIEYPDDKHDLLNAYNESDDFFFLKHLNLKLGRWDTKLLFKMFDHTIVGNQFISLSSQYRVCLATQSSLEKLSSLVQVATHWRGPISAAVYAAGNDELNLLLLYLFYLRKCFAQIREQVTFHIAYPKDRAPNRTDVNMSVLRALNCSTPEMALQYLLRLRSPATIKWRVRNPYPQNHLRNLARKNCQSGNVFLTDVDIVPSYGLAEGLDRFLRTATCASGLCAYVIPTYELDERVHFPRNKTDLLRLAKKGLARPFHQKVFIYNQFATNISRWQEHQDAVDSNGYPEVHVSHPVTNFEFFYEPFYVAPDTVPPHDERFVGYGFTRNTQVYEMFVAGYEFLVLSPAFTCHWGLQLKKSRPSWRERQNILNSRYFSIFKHEVFARYNKDPLNMINTKNKAAKTALGKST